MPTGYTEIIESKEDVTFKEYATRCVRAMGVCIMQRDESMDSPPRIEGPSEYHKKECAKARAKLAELSGASDESIRALFDAEVERAEKYNIESAAKEVGIRARYAKIRAEVVAWKAPTPDHENFKCFMLEQIDMCYEPDRAPYAQPIPVFDGYRERLIASASRDVEYHAAEYAKDVERAAERGAWLRAFFKSIDVEPPPLEPARW